MADYNNAKPSFQIEDQLPAFIRSTGPNFVDFIKTYYDWIERNYVILTLKAVNDVDKAEISNKTLTILPDHYQIIMEDIDGDTSGNVYLMSDESIDSETNYQTTTLSLLLNGIDQYGYASHEVVNVQTSWTIACWMKINVLPSDIRNDYDIITLSDAKYIAPLKIEYKANEIWGVFDTVTVKTGLYVYNNVWNLMVIRYDDVSKTIQYDVLNQLGANNSFSTALDLSGLLSNIFVVGCDLYTPTTPNFYNGYIDEMATWDSTLTNNNVIALYNNGNPANLLDTFSPSTFNSALTDFDSMDISFNDTTGNNVISNYYKFEDANSTVCLNSVDTYNNLSLIHTPEYTVDVPLNTIAMITENERSVALVVKVLSSIKYENIPNYIMGNRILAFCEHINGKLQVDVPIYVTNDGVEVLIDSYVDVKSPINVINNIDSYQEIDYTLRYGNYIYNDFFINPWKELMYGFPIFLHDVHEESIKDIIAKQIKDFYLCKGTLKSFKYIFKILYNEDLEIGTDILYDGLFSYRIKTVYASASIEILETLKMISHPVGFKVTLEQK